MSEGNGIMSCRNTCWIVGALLGLVAFLLIFQSSVLWALVVGIALAIAVAFVLQRLFCSGAALDAEPHVGMGASGATLAALGADQTRAASDVPGAGEGARFAEDGAETHAKAVTAAAGPQDETAPVMEDSALAASRASSATSTREESGTEAPAKGAVAKKPAASAGAKGGAAKAPASKKTATEGPELLTAPRGGTGDDLKQIKGVGPKFEKLLNATGVWHFDQIASWSKKDIAVVDAKLKGFHGRIERDDWVSQAKTLAEGGETAFSKKVKKGDVY